MNRSVRRFVAGAFLASLTAGTITQSVQAAPAPEHGQPVAAAVAKASNDNKFQYISQVQGQPTQYVDCGPASMLMALLQNNGRVPGSYNPSDQKRALAELRNEAPSGQEYLRTTDIAAVLTKRGVQGTELVNDDAFNAINQIKNGKHAIVLTSTGVIEGEDISRAGDGHYVYISGYNKKDNTFTVNDPLKLNKKAYQATEQQLHNIIAAAAQGNSRWAYTM